MGSQLIYQLSETVFDALVTCASNEYYTFAVLEPKEDETPRRRKSLLRDLEEVKDLVQLGILRDISLKYKDDIDKCQAEHGFGYKVVEFTKEGVLMFAHADNRVVN